MHHSGQNKKNELCFLEKRYAFIRVAKKELNLPTNIALTVFNTFK